MASAPCATMHARKCVDCLSTVAASVPAMQPKGALTGCAKAPHQGPKHGGRIGFHRAHNFYELDDVDPSFAALVFGYKRLGSF